MTSKRAAERIAIVERDGARYSKSKFTTLELLFMSASKSQVRFLRGPIGLRSLAILAGIAVFLALAGAFGTGQVSLARRMLFWLPLLWLGAACAAMVELRSSNRPRVGQNLIWRIAATVTAISIPMALIAWTWAALLFRNAGEVSLLQFGWGTFVVVGFVTAAMIAINTPGVATGEQADGPPGEPAQSFVERLPVQFRGSEIYALSSEDHYLRVHTTLGAPIILMRLADAINDMAQVDGAQVHRSWWVSRAAVVGISRHGRQMSLELANGLSVPVSRANMKAVAASGWAPVRS